ncbi:hypothetical protein V6N12_069331 [Hibiscus sabdariffa]|uniref:non-specific serine/threonine protein kinase n=1 Tax=Hibiscus sabdariffa TaxID=183260 RepID=A0ABR2FDK6_9ROSI
MDSDVVSKSLIQFKPLLFSSALHSVYINCGGGPTTINGTAYEADLHKAGPSTFLQSESDTKWALSSTGVFLDENQSDDILVVTGRRIFDVYIQGKLVLKDFNIKQEAGGAGRPIVKPFAVNVTDGTLEIHFRWAGKGTTNIPRRGVYGPLISAISIFNPGRSSDVMIRLTSSLISCFTNLCDRLIYNVSEPAYRPLKSTTAVTRTAKMVGIVGGAVLAALLLIVGILWWKGCLRRERTLEQDGTSIAVKQLSVCLKQGNREFVTEIGMISALQHPHLAHVLKEQGNLLALVDIRIGSDYNIDELMTMIIVALLCTNPTASARPLMSSVVMKKNYGKLEDDDTDISQTKSMLADGAWTGSTSAADLYPVSLTSGYWQSRDSTN